MIQKDQQIDTLLIHAGEPEPVPGNPVNPPIYQSSTYHFSEGVAYDDIRYIRLNNSLNHEVLHKKLAVLGGGEDALVMGSGMAAIATAFLAFLRPGDHVILQRCVYGGTHGLLTKHFEDLGIRYTFVEGDQPSSWDHALDEKSKIFYIESMSNPLMEVPDIKAVAAFSKKHGLISMIDNTFPTPVNFKPLEYGIDLSLHSATKYLNGHSDLAAGAVIGSAEHIALVKKKLNLFGGMLDTHCCFLLHRGLKTLALRVRQHNHSAMALATFLEAHDKIAKVHYPGLASHKQHHLAKDLFDGFSGMLSFELKKPETAAALIEALTIPVHAVSLGGVESLIIRPAVATQSGMSEEERQKSGVADGLIRLSVGLEGTEDLIKDFDQALSMV